VVALLLSVCGVDRETIIENYAESEVHLRYVMEEIMRENRTMGLDSQFDGTPRQVMREALAFLDCRWGSVSAYLNDECGFSFVEQMYLRKLLILPRRGSTRAQPQPPPHQGKKEAAASDAG